MPTSGVRTTVAATTFAIALTAASSLHAQSNTIVYRLGKDTVAIEQYTRTATRIVGEMVQRSGPAVTRMQYDIAVGKDGRPATASFKRMQGDGTLPPNSPSETQFRVNADSVVREIVWADSVQRRAFASKTATLMYPTFVYGPTELLMASKRSGVAIDSVPAIGLTGNPGYTGFTTVGGDTVRLKQSGGAYPMVMRFDAKSQLQYVDGFGTTNKSIGTRSNGKLDIASIAKTMKPTGTLSSRDMARGAFGQGGMVIVDYGRPMVRERSVWGGTLVPYDSVWRAGANDATHLFTTRTLAFGTVNVPPGMYSLWVQHTRNGTFLIVNKQTGQWGTQYDATQDLARIAMQMSPTPSAVEEMTVSVKQFGGNRGAIEFAWGPSAISAPFTASVAR